MTQWLLFQVVSKQYHFCAFNKIIGFFIFYETMALSFHAIFPGQISDETAKINAIIVVDVNVSIRMLKSPFMVSLVRTEL